MSAPSNAKAETLLAPTNYAQGGNSSTHNRDEMYGYSAMAYIAVTTAASKTFIDGGVNVTFNQITTQATHGYVTGQLIQLTTTGAVPTGLVKDTNYYVIYLDQVTISLATTRALALAGTAIDITAAGGGGTHTLVPTALAAAEIHLEQSLDGVRYTDVVGSTFSVSATVNLNWNMPDVFYPYVRMEWTLTAGQLNIESAIYSVGPNSRR